MYGTHRHHAKAVCKNAGGFESEEGFDSQEGEAGAPPILVTGPRLTPLGLWLIPRPPVGEPGSPPTTQTCRRVVRTMVLSYRPRAVASWG